MPSVGEEKREKNSVVNCLRRLSRNHYLRTRVKCTCAISLNFYIYADWRQNRNRLKQQVCTCITLFCTFLDYDTKSFLAWARERERVLSPFPSLVSHRFFFFVNFCPALYYPNALNKLIRLRHSKPAISFWIHIFDVFSPKRVTYEFKKNKYTKSGAQKVRDQFLKNLGFSIRRYQNYRTCMEKLRFSKNWSRTSLHSRFIVLFLWTPGQRYCVALWKSYLSLLVLHYITRWYCLYLTTVGSFGIAQWPG